MENISEYSDAWINGISLSEDNPFDNIEIICDNYNGTNKCPCFKSVKKSKTCYFFHKENEELGYGNYVCNCPKVKKYWMEIFKKKADLIYAKESLKLTLNGII